MAENEYYLVEGYHKIIHEYRAGLDDDAIFGKVYVVKGKEAD